MLLFHVLFQKLIDSTFGKETRATNQSADMKTYTFFWSKMACITTWLILHSRSTPNAYDVRVGTVMAMALIFSSQSNLILNIFNLKLIKLESDF